VSTRPRGGVAGRRSRLRRQRQLARAGAEAQVDQDRLVSRPDDRLTVDLLQRAPTEFEMLESVLLLLTGAVLAAPMLPGFALPLAGLILLAVVFLAPS
jgi:hypothetical protein